jgi:dUTP pyrophosphatase
MKVKFKRLHRDAVIPSKKYKADFCYDCVAVSEEEVAPNVWRYGLGFALQIDRGIEPMVVSTTCHGGRVADHYTMMDFSRTPMNLSIDARPRSSVWKTGMVLSNCEGTIDENYTGEISAVFYHILPDMPRYRVGDRVCQIKIGATFPIEFAEVAEFDETDRGENGYGSTGK